MLESSEVALPLFPAEDCPAEMAIGLRTCSRESVVLSLSDDRFIRDLSRCAVTEKLINFHDGVSVPGVVPSAQAGILQHISTLPAVILRN